MIYSVHDFTIYCVLCFKKKNLAQCLIIFLFWLLFQHLIERSWYAVTETCLAFTVFRDDFSPRFVALFTLLLFLKCFHWLAEDRIDYVSVFAILRLLIFTIEEGTVYLKLFLAMQRQHCIRSSGYFMSHQTMCLHQSYCLYKLCAARGYFPQCLKNNLL